jgi:hypothetical protein
LHITNKLLKLKLKNKSKLSLIFTFNYNKYGNDLKQAWKVKSMLPTYKMTTCL